MVWQDGSTAHIPIWTFLVYFEKATQEHKTHSNAHVVLASTFSMLHLHF